MREDNAKTRSTASERKVGLDRRGFLKGAFTVGAATIAAGALGGCSQASGQSSSADALVSAMNEEERAQAIADSTYMGGKTDYYGQEIQEVTLPNGQVTTKYVADFLSYYNMEPFEKVRDRVYVSHVYPLCNAVMIEGDTGMIIIDTSGNVESATKDLEFFRTVTDKPVSAILFSHDHYSYGTTAYIPEDNPDNIPLVMHEDTIETIARTIGPIAPTYALRAKMHFGAMLPVEGPDAPWAASYAGGGKETLGFVEPNVLIPREPEMTEMKIDGLTFRFYPGTSDSPATMSIYCVELDVLQSNHVWSCYFNMYTLRGEKYRDPEYMIPQIDTLRAIHPEYLIPSQGPFLSGRENIDKELTLYRDSVQYVFDQTVRYMNKGYDADQITTLVDIPAALVQGPLTHPVYGEVEHYIRGVYRGLVGWYGNDAMDLHPVTKEFEYGKLVSALGGEGAVVEAAQKALDDRQFAWAAKLGTYVLANNPEHEDARAVKAEALRQMGRTSQASTTRSFLMTGCYDLEGDPKEGADTAFGSVTKDRLKAMPRTLILDKIRVSLDPAKAEGVSEGLAITFTDEGVTNSIVVRNYVAAVEEGRSEAANIELQLPYTVMMSIAVGETSLANSLADGSAVIVGDEEAFDVFMDRFEIEL